MAEDTVIRTIDLPPGQDWAWYADLNVVGLSSRLDEAARARALDELQIHWRRRCLRIVPDESEEPRTTAFA